MAPISFGILTVSDTCFNGQNNDTSGPKLEELIKISFPDALISYKSIVPDDKCIIENILKDWAEKKCNIILTTGGTGFAERDVTPEATKAVIEKDAPGLSYAMITKSLEITKMAMLSRPVCGIRDRSIIINLPGSVKAVTECFDIVKHSFKHAVALLHNESGSVAATHRHIQSNVITESKVQIKCTAFRNRHSPYPMLEVGVAQSIVIEQCKSKNEIEEIDINDALYRVLAENIESEDPLPPFPASIKDGYAVKAKDGTGVRIVREVVAAGDQPFNSDLLDGEIIRISTGAPIPAGADSVVQVEDTELLEASSDGSTEITVRINVAPKLGQDIRPIGSDIPTGFILLHQDDIITAAHIGILAAIGKTKIKVKRRLVIGIISTGNELQNPHEVLKPSHIRDSNKLTLINLLKQYNYSSNDCGIAKDDPNCVKRILIGALSKHSVIITTGGVSMGEYDVIKQVLIEDFNATVHFGRVNMKPGKPTTFATCTFNGDEKYIFALPGNPVSATVTSILFVIPALRHLEGFQADIHNMKVVLDEKIPLDSRPEYMRAQISMNDNGTIKANITGNQISSRLNSVVGAHVLLVLPPRNDNQLFLDKGTVVDALRIAPFIL